MIWEKRSDYSCFLCGMSRLDDLFVIEKEGNVCGKIGDPAFFNQKVKPVHKTIPVSVTRFSLTPIHFLNVSNGHPHYGVSKWT